MLDRGSGNVLVLVLNKALRYVKNITWHSALVNSRYFHCYHYVANSYIGARTRFNHPQWNTVACRLNAWNGKTVKPARWDFAKIIGCKNVKSSNGCLFEEV
jgi:hypothetical protein